MTRHITKSVWKSFLSNTRGGTEFSLCRPYDIETFSSVSLPKCGVYKYTESPDFEILLFGYSVDGGPVSTIDLACGEKLPEDVLAALTDDEVTKWAFNAQFERVCLSRYLSDMGLSLDPFSDHHPLATERARFLNLKASVPSLGLRNKSS